MKTFVLVFALLTIGFASSAEEVSATGMWIDDRKSPDETLNPDYFEGVSLTALATRLGLHKAILSAQAAEARRKFGIHNRGQAHGWNFGKSNGQPKSQHEAPK